MYVQILNEKAYKRKLVHMQTCMLYTLLDSQISYLLLAAVSLLF